MALPTVPVTRKQTSQWIRYTTRLGREIHTDEVDDGHTPDEEGDDAGADGAADVEGQQPEDGRERGVPEEVLIVQLHDGRW